MEFQVEIERTLENIDEKKEISFLSSKQIHRNSLPIPCELGRKQIIWKIHRFLTDEECDEIIQVSEKAGFEQLDHLYKKEYRDSQRILAFDANQNLIQTLTERLLNGKFLDILEIHQWKKPYGFHTDEYHWVRNDGEINPCLRINKYPATSTGFGWHRDAQYTQTTDFRSNYTLVVYLSDHDDGAIHFISPKNKFTHQGYTVQQEMDLIEAGGGFDTLKITPKKGMAVVFDQRLLHMAEPCSKTKYILRTDLLCYGAIRMDPKPMDHDLIWAIKRIIYDIFNQLEAHIEVFDNDTKEMLINCLWDETEEEMKRNPESPDFDRVFQNFTNQLDDFDEEIIDLFRQIFMDNVLKIKAIQDEKISHALDKLDQPIKETINLICGPDLTNKTTRDFIQVMITKEIVAAINKNNKMPNFEEVIKNVLECYVLDDETYHHIFKTFVTKADQLYQTTLHSLEDLTRKLFRQAQYYELHDSQENIKQAQELYEICLSLRQNPQQITQYPKHLEELLIDLPINQQFLSVKLLSRSGDRYVFAYSKDQISQEELEQCLKISTMITLFLLIRSLNQEIPLQQLLGFPITKITTNNQPSEDKKDRQRRFKDYALEHDLDLDDHYSDNEIKEYIEADELFEAYLQEKYPPIKWDLRKHTQDIPNDFVGLVLSADHKILHSRCYCMLDGDEETLDVFDQDRLSAKLDNFGLDINTISKNENMVKGQICMKTIKKSFNHASCQCEHYVDQVESVAEAHWLVDLKFEFEINLRKAIMIIKHTPMIVI